MTPVAKWVLKDSPASARNVGKWRSVRAAEEVGEVKRGRLDRGGGDEKERGERTRGETLTTSDELVELRVAVRLDLVGLSERRRVAVGGDEVAPDELAGLDANLVLAVVEGGLDLGAASNASDGRSETERLLDEALQGSEV